MYDKMMIERLWMDQMDPIRLLHIILFLKLRPLRVKIPFANASSNKLKLGLYDGRYQSIAPAPRTEIASLST